MLPSQPGDDAAPELQPISVFFTPKTVAVIGATETPNSLGRVALWNLLSSPFGGTVFPVNPQRKAILGVKAYARVADVPEPIDLAMIVTPAATVPTIIEECAQAGVKGAIIVAAGFRAAGEAGLALEQQALAAARRTGLRLLGPNCLGLMRPRHGLNASCARTMAHTGNLAFISQSASLSTAVLDWSLRERVGFSHFISLGSMLDVGWADLIDYLGDDPQTQSIVMYMESVGNARAFLSAAREVALSKPIIVIKAGRSELAAQAAASHTGALVESDAVFDAALRRCGVLRVPSIGDMFAMAEVLARQPRPRGPRLTILTNSGGPGVLATDALLTSGGELATLSPQTLADLQVALPTNRAQTNPIDLQGDADDTRYDQVAEIAARDPQSDGLLVILTPLTTIDPTRTAERIRQRAGKTGKPLLTSWMGGAEVAAGKEVLQQAGIPSFEYPDTAARAFQYMWQYSENLRVLYETPTLPTDDQNAPNRDAIDQIIATARETGRTVLSEAESKQLLAAYGFPVVGAHIAREPEEAVAVAERIGYPVVLKLHAEGVTHKSDFGGVQLNLADATQVRRAFQTITASARALLQNQEAIGVTVQRMVTASGYELMLGSSVDRQFGPVLLFGAGGQLVEVIKDRSLGLPPLNTTLARRMMEQTRIFTALKGVRGRAPVNLAALEQLVVRFSQLVAEQPRIKEIDVNPLHASADGLAVLDARIVLHDPNIEDNALPRVAIRPYPVQYITPWALKDGAPVTIRPIRPEDEPLMVAFHQTLSEQSVYFRYFRSIDLDRRVAHERLTRICFLDYDREMALVAVRRDAKTQAGQIIGVGRLTRHRTHPQAEFALLISDQFQGHGLGTELLSRLVQIGRDEGLKRIVGYVLPENRGMLRVAERVGFRIKRSMDMAEAIIDLA